MSPPIRVKCQFGVVRPNLPNPGVSFDSLRVTMEEAFRNGSYRGTQKPPNIDLTVSHTNANAALIPANKPTSHGNLQQALRNLIGAQAPLNQARKVGLLFADRYVPYPNAYGYMIDGSIHPNDPFAREGAVVFLHPILQDRNHLGPTAVRREYVFTAVHEMGHVFNLWHRNETPNFMANSGAVPYPTSAHKFVNKHKQYLRISHPDYVKFMMPGAAPWGARPPGFPAHGDPQNAPRPQRQLGKRLRLTIKIAQKAFYYFEPVELDLTLSCARRQRVDVPDQLDPGYDGFDIWIESPTGERVRYRPIKRFMEGDWVREIHGGQPFHRDVSLFAQRGGYTFHESGVYRIFATFDTSHGILKSNTTECEVLENDDSRAFTLLQETLARPRILDRLFYREADLTPVDRKLCAAIQRRLPNTHFAAALQYAQARHDAIRLLTQKRPRRSALTACTTELNAAADLTALSPHRRRRAAVVSAQLHERLT